MITVLDTNVVSEWMRLRPDPAVVTWWSSIPDEHVSITAVTAAELLHGVAKMPAGRRRDELAERVEMMLSPEYLGGRVVPFDFAAATQYAAVLVARSVAGRPITIADAQIAAICRTRGSVLATRNIKDFEGTGVELVNPWETPVS